MKNIGISLDAELITNLFSCNRDVLKFIEDVKKMGITHLEFSNFKYGAYGEGLKVYTEAFKLISENIGVSLHFSPFAKIAGKELKGTWRWKSRLINFMKFAYNVDALWINMHMGEADKHYKGSFVEDLAEALTDIICICDELGIHVPVTMENSFQGSLQRGREYGICSGHFVEIFRCLDDLGKKKGKRVDIGLVVDVAHLNITGEQLGNYRKISDKIKAWHISDNLGSSDRGGIRDPHRVIGQGSIDWEYVIKFIDECCYNTILIIENKNVGDSICSLKQIKEIMKK